MKNNTERDALLDRYYPTFRDEHAVLRASGVSCSRAYEALARSYGFNTWIGMFTDLKSKVY